MTLDKGHGSKECLDHELAIWAARQFYAKPAAAQPRLQLYIH
jgi:hypothetical protein